MRLLLDTCTFLWLAADDPRLTAAARTKCRDPENEIYLSALSAWEISIKHRLGLLPLPEAPARYVTSRRSWLLIEPLAFDEACAAHDALLPPHHRDPFDRGLVSQAILHGMTIVTPRYGDRPLSGSGALARKFHRFAKRGRGDGRASACFASLVCIRKANASQGAQGEPDKGEVPVALRPGERASHGWLARPASGAGTAKRSRYLPVRRAPQNTDAAFNAANVVRSASAAVNR